jgi:hypothetical protein
LNNNRNNNNNNRRRGRGSNNRQPGGQQLNRIDSRARGNAPQMLEKYRKLAHDAHLNGDRVTEEYNLQFADHYFRVIADQRVRQDEQRQPRPNDRPGEFGDEYAEDDFYGDANSPYDRAGNYAPSVQGSTQGNGVQGGQQGNYQNGNGQNGNGQNGQGQNGNFQGGNSQGGNSQGGSGQSGNAQNGSPQNGNGQNAGQGSQGGNGANAGGGQGGEPRADRGRRNRDDRPERGERQDRGERTERQPRAAAPAGGDQQLDLQPTGADQGGQDTADRSVYEPTENPFVRAERAPRTPRARKPRRDDGVEASASAPANSAQDEPAGNLDPSMLPPAISRRDDAGEDAPAKPKRRTRRAAPPADDAAGALETVN